MVPQFVAVSSLLLQVDIDLNFDPATGLAGGGVGAFLTTLVVGAILVALAPDYTVEKMAAVVDDPVGAFVYGFAVFLLLLLVVIVLVFTFVGIVVAIPLAIVGYVVWAIGSTIAFLAIAGELVSREDGWVKPLVVAAAINGALAFTGVGGLVAIAVGAAGFGVVVQDHL